MSTTPDLAERMSTWRAYRGRTLEEVGAACGMSRQAINYVETGANSISVAKLEAICSKVFEISLRRFFGKLPEVKR